MMPCGGHTHPCTYDAMWETHTHPCPYDAMWAHAHPCWIHPHSRRNFWSPSWHCSSSTLSAGPNARHSLRLQTLLGPPHGAVRITTLWAVIHFHHLSEKNVGFIIHHYLRFHLQLILIWYRSACHFPQRWTQSRSQWFLDIWQLCFFTTDIDWVIDLYYFHKKGIPETQSWWKHFAVLMMNYAHKDKSFQSFPAYPKTQGVPFAEPTRVSSTTAH